MCVQASVHKSQKADTGFTLSTPPPSSVTQVSITTGARQLIIYREKHRYTTHIEAAARRERVSHSRNTANFHLLSKRVYTKKGRKREREREEMRKKVPSFAPDPASERLYTSSSHALVGGAIVSRLLFFSIYIILYPGDSSHHPISQPLFRPVSFVNQRIEAKTNLDAAIELPPFFSIMATYYKLLIISAIHYATRPPKPPDQIMARDNHDSLLSISKYSIFVSTRNSDVCGKEFLRIARRVGQIVIPREKICHGPGATRARIAFAGT